MSASTGDGVSALRTVGLVASESPATAGVASTENRPGYGRTDKGSDVPNDTRSAASRERRKAH